MIKMTQMIKMTLNNLELNYKIRKKSVWYIYENACEILPMYSDKENLSKIDDIVINVGMHSGVLAYRILDQMIELAKQTPRNSNLMKHKTKWWVENSQINNDVLPLSRDNVIELISEMDCYDGAALSLVFWNEQYFHLISNSGLSVNHKTQLLKIHEKVVRFHSDNSEWDKGRFEFKLDE
jgi:hypothetical protein